MRFFGRPILHDHKVRLLLMSPNKLTSPSLQSLCGHDKEQVDSRYPVRHLRCAARCRNLYGCMVCRKPRQIHFLHRVSFEAEEPDSVMQLPPIHVDVYHTCLLGNSPDLTILQVSISFLFGEHHNLGELLPLLRAPIRSHRYHGFGHHLCRLQEPLPVDDTESSRRDP